MQRLSRIQVWKAALACLETDETKNDDEERSAEYVCTFPLVLNDGVNHQFVGPFEDTAQDKVAKKNLTQKFKRERGGL